MATDGQQKSITISEERGQQEQQVNDLFLPAIH